ncbi:hypothetical protein LCGC14_2547180, partial [marine sediment metagenome]
AAEIRYGNIPKLEKGIKEQQKKLVEVQKKRQILKEEVTPEDMASVVSRWTGIPVYKMLEEETVKLSRMEDELRKRIIGQDEALSIVANAIRRSRAGIAEENKPIGSFMFMGPTGVGKTELGLALAEFMFNDEDAIIRLDMSEYMERHTVSKIIGSPPGYVGHEEGGQLTEIVRRRPYSVILFDEIEKAHPEVFNILLQIMDYATLTDNSGRKADFRNIILIMTSNAGAQELGKRLVGFGERSVKGDALNRAVEDLFSPEFRNRLDATVTFNDLDKKIVLQIVQKEIDLFKIQLALKNVTLTLSKGCLKWLAEKGYSPLFGAREISRLIQDKIKSFFVDEVLFGSLAHGGRARAEIEGDEVIIKVGD